MNPRTLLNSYSYQAEKRERMRPVQSALPRAQILDQKAFGFSFASAVSCLENKFIVRSAEAKGHK
jgi:hypothetical protein